MRVQHDPFKGMTPEEIARYIYNVGSLDDDCNKAIQLLGGVDNIIGFEDLSYEEACKKLKEVNIASNYFHVALKDFEETVFHKKDCSQRLVNCRLTVFHTDKKCYVEVGKGVVEYFRALQEYYASRK